jgi:hypothetical protein
METLGAIVASRPDCTLAVTRGAGLVTQGDVAVVASWTRFDLS